MIWQTEEQQGREKGWLFQCEETFCLQAEEKTQGERKRLCIKKRSITDKTTPGKLEWMGPSIKENTPRIRTDK